MRVPAAKSRPLCNTTKTLYPSGSRGYFEEEFEITPSQLSESSVARVFSTADGVENLGGDYSTDIKENTAPSVGQPAYSPGQPEEGDTVFISSYIRDSDGTYYYINWEQVSGPRVSIQGSSSESPQFTVPDISEDKSVKLKVTATDSLDKSASQTVEIPLKVKHSDPSADFEFTPSSPIIDERITFDPAPSSDSDGFIDIRKWDIDDDGTFERSSDTYEEITYSFSTPGDYPVTLKVVDDEGDANQVTKTVTVKDGEDPKAIVGPDRTVSTVSPVNFDGGGSSDNIGVTSYKWDIDNDGSYEKTGASISHTFESTGTKTVTLQVSDAAGNTDTDDVRVNVEDQTNPNANAGSDRTVSTGTVNFDGSGSSDNIGVTSYKWDVNNDGTYEKTGASISHTFQSTGRKTVTLQVSDAAGNTDTDDAQVTVEDQTKPNANAGSDKTVSIGSTVNFDGSRSSDNIGVTSYKWDVDNDGTYEKTGASISHTFQSTGIKTVTLQVSDAAGNTDTDDVFVTVETAPDTTDPTANAGSDETVSIGSTVKFDGSGSSDNIGVTSYKWDVNNDGTYEKMGASISHTFQSTGTKTVTLQVSDAAGNTATDDVLVTVETAPDTTDPTANAGSNKKVSLGNTVNFDGSVSSDNTGITTYEWDVDNDGTYEKTGASISHTFQSSGIKTVTLRVSDAAGNTNTDAVSVNVAADDKPVAVVSAENVSAQNGTEATVQFELENTGRDTNGYILDLDLPERWTVVNHTTDAGTWKPSENKWLWQSIAPNEEVKPTVTMSVPDEAEGTYTISAEVLADDSVVTETTATVTVIDSLSIDVAVDENNDNKIGDFEILQAIEYWRTGETVPDTGGKTIDDFDILNLIETWRNNADV